MIKDRHGHNALHVLALCGDKLFRHLFAIYGGEDLFVMEDDNGRIPSINLLTQEQLRSELQATNKKYDEKVAELQQSSAEVARLMSELKAMVQKYDIKEAECNAATKKKYNDKESDCMAGSVHINQLLSGIKVEKAKNAELARCLKAAEEKNQALINNHDNYHKEFSENESYMSNPKRYNKRKNYDSEDDIQEEQGGMKAPKRHHHINTDSYSSSSSESLAWLKSELKNCMDDLKVERKKHLETTEKLQDAMNRLL